MAAPVSDALVFFGATGDLAEKQIFPALQAMARHKHLDMPIIGVAWRDWTLGQFRAPARESLEKHGVVDEAVFAKLAALLQYVRGGGDDLDTFKRLRQALGNAQHPIHYLAIPPSLFEVVAANLAQSGCAEGAPSLKNRSCTIQFRWSNDFACERNRRGRIRDHEPLLVPVGLRQARRRRGGLGSNPRSTHGTCWYLG